MPSIGFNVTELSDEELFSKLESLGVENMGPIVASTRKLYQRKLLALMNAVDEPYFPQNDNSEDSSNDESPAYNNSPVKSPPPAEPIKSSPTTRYRTQVKQSQDNDSVASTSKSNLGSNLSYTTYDQRTPSAYDQHTPSARPSLRSVISSKTTEYSSSRGNMRETTSLRETFNTRKSSPTEKSKFCVRLLVKIFIVIVIGLALYMSYQYMYSESPLKELENLARQTLASMKDGDVKQKQPKIKN